CQPKPGPNQPGMGRFDGPGDAVQPLSTHRGADRDGCVPGDQEGGAIRVGYDARRHPDVLLPAPGHHRDHRRAAVPARRGAWPPGRSPGSDTVRWLAQPKHEEKRPLLERSTEMEAVKKIPTPEINVTPPTTAPRRTRAQALFAPELVRPAVVESFKMLRPDVQWRNPVMFVVEIGAVLTLLFIVQAALGMSSSQVPISYFIALDIWLWLTVLFANFATALAEARGRAQAESLRAARRDTPAFRLKGADIIEQVLSSDLRMGDRVVVEAGQFIPGDGEVIEGIAS